jgi:hypothetical protein
MSQQASRPGLIRLLPKNPSASWQDPVQTRHTTGSKTPYNAGMGRDASGTSGRKEVAVVREMTCGRLKGTKLGIQGTRLSAEIKRR